MAIRYSFGYCDMRGVFGTFEAAAALVRGPIRGELYVETAILPEPNFDLDEIHQAQDMLRANDCSSGGATDRT